MNNVVAVEKPHMILTVVIVVDWPGASGHKIFQSASPTPLGLCFSSQREKNSCECETSENLTFVGTRHSDV